MPIYLRMSPILSDASHLRDYPITFGCREKGNRHDANQMEDFFGMMEFDCLIRSVSNFTLMHTVIGDYLAIITPKHCMWRYRIPPYKDQYVENYVDEVEIQTAEDLAVLQEKKETTFCRRRSETVLVCNFWDRHFAI